VLVYENHTAQSVVIAGSLHAGSLYESPAKNGLASLTADSLLRGTQHRDFDTIHDALEGIGADLDLNAGAHKAGFGGKALAEDLPTLIDLLGDALRTPAFPEQQVERLRGETLTWLQYRQQDTRWLAGRLFNQNLYPADHPYHYSTSGTVETLPGITLDDLRAFHGRHYGPQGMIIAIVGAVTAPEAVDTVRQGLGDWQNPDQPEAPDLPEVIPPEEIRRASLGIPGKTQSDLVLGVPGPSRYADDYQAATLVNSVLGQFGMMGRVGKSIREERGYAYYAFSQVSGGYGPGAWNVVAGVNPVNVEESVKVIGDEIRRLTTEPVSADDLADNQSYFTGRLPLQLEKNEGLAGTLLNIESYDLGLDYVQKYHQMIDTLTADDLLAAAQHYLNPEAFVLSVVGPENSG
jgi:zinc protease